MQKFISLYFKIIMQSVLQKYFWICNLSAWIILPEAEVDVIFSDELGWRRMSRDVERKDDVGI